MPYMFMHNTPIPEVARGISEIQAVLPNLRVIVVVSEFATPTLVQSVEECFPGLNPGTSLKWRFRTEQDFKAVWYSRIALE
ncbi:hypothetical protein FB45DRAFT_1031934 [Roridomyces roridus]|uniref:Uncharacterized protein n=1 Tax=Roridomyces roridus TaxID=1738132 RepID=A0AAD7BJ45_9AGAR|nr:hypothetical protein FB45DRAFT_1031934 [Roridomyces roridus]